MDTSRNATGNDLDYVFGLLQRYPGFPKAGVNFFDIFPIFQEPAAVEIIMDTFYQHITDRRIDVVVGLEARGFLLGPILALKLNVPFVPVRKEGKLPGKCLRVTYEKHYGPDTFEMQEGVIPPGARVAIVDDVLSTGGTAAAASALVKQCGATVVYNLFILEGKRRKGAALLDAPVFSLFSV
ncbi:phosphoribosyltransferase-like protein [Syncephalastrum racemosum]|uniref:adenine phosphoribosyltransferase n=1 Tax=Syncephalastrum racemosum TaxID=13706 RepID=A0A1X2HUF1_SYNRA|nr:phosphoribosyltransferase-like protein [Syncephalastrum racemosum]